MKKSYEMSAIFIGNNINFRIGYLLFPNNQITDGLRLLKLFDIIALIDIKN